MEAASTNMSNDDQTDARKYLFDLSFDSDVGTGGKKKEPEPTFSKDDLEAAKAAAHQEGFNAGKAEANREQDARIEFLLNNIDTKVLQAMRESGSFWESQVHLLQKTVLVIAQKIMPSYVKKHGLDEIKAIVTKVMAEMSQEPRLVFRVSEEQFDEAKKRIDEVAKDAAYDGKLIVLGDKDLTESECRIEWTDGGIERDLKSLWEHIEQVMGEVQTIDAKALHPDEGAQATAEPPSTPTQPAIEPAPQIEPQPPVTEQPIETQPEMTAPPQPTDPVNPSGDKS